MINYTHVRAKNDIYDDNGDILCFAGEVYRLTDIDEEKDMYAVMCEPEIGGYWRKIIISLYDPEFDFIKGATVEIVDTNTGVATPAIAYVDGDIVIVDEIVEEVIEEEYYDNDYYDDGDDW